MGDLDPPLSISHRRSHLKSKAFQSLLRILSYCSDDSFASPSILPGCCEPDKITNSSHVLVDSSSNLSSYPGKDDFVDRGCLGLGKSSVAKESNEDGNFIITENGAFRKDDSTREPVDQDKVESNSVLIEKYGIVDGNCKLIDRQNRISCDGELGQITQAEGNDESFHRDDHEFEKLSTEEIARAEDFLHYESLLPSILSVQPDRIVEEGPKLSFPPNDGRGYEQIGAAKLPKEAQQEANHEFLSMNSLLLDTQNEFLQSEHATEEKLGCRHMPREGQYLEASACSDTIANSVSPIVRQEIEEGEISDDLSIPEQPMDSILEENIGASEDRKAEEAWVSDGCIAQEGSSQTSKEQLGVDRKKMLSVSNFAGRVDSGENWMEVKINEKKGIREDDESEVLNNRKTIGVWPFGDNCMQTLGETEVGGTKIKDYAAGQEAPNASLGMAREVTEKIGFQCHGTESAVKDTKVREKKKRGPLTEERKAKKKVSKKRKRAKMNREQGVKRLKLKPFTKTKVVHDCRFYLKGRCQQGDKCKFSHAGTPMTKSQPCTYFALGTCLKGEDCPFDHQLSKYPCTNFNTKGLCRRGETCLFSHKITLSAGFSLASKVRNSEPTLPLEKVNMQKPMITNEPSPISVNHLSKDASRTRTASSNSHLDTHRKQLVAEMWPRPPAKAPEGIRFLSFGKAPSDTENKQLQDNNLPSDEKHRIGIHDIQKQITSDKFQDSFKPQAYEHKNPPISSPKETSPMLAFGGKHGGGKHGSDTTSRFFQSPLLKANAGNVSGSSSFSSGLATTTPAETGGSQSRSTDASKILEEFLFSGLTQ